MENSTQPQTTLPNPPTPDQVEALIEEIEKVSGITNADHKDREYDHKNPGYWPLIRRLEVELERPLTEAIMKACSNPDKDSETNLISLTKALWNILKSPLEPIDVVVFLTKMDFTHEVRRRPEFVVWRKKDALLFFEAFLRREKLDKEKLGKKEGESLDTILKNYYRIKGIKMLKPSLWQKFKASQALQRMEQASRSGIASELRNEASFPPISEAAPIRPKNQRKGLQWGLGALGATALLIFTGIFGPRMGQSGQAKVTAPNPKIKTAAPLMRRLTAPVARALVSTSSKLHPNNIQTVETTDISPALNSLMGSLNTAGDTTFHYDREKHTLECKGETFTLRMGGNLKDSHSRVEISDNNNSIVLSTGLKEQSWIAYSAFVKAGKATHQSKESIKAAVDRIALHTAAPKSFRWYAQQSLKRDLNEANKNSGGRLQSHKATLAAIVPSVNHSPNRRIAFTSPSVKDPLSSYTGTQWLNPLTTPQSPSRQFALSNLKY